MMIRVEPHWWKGIFDEVYLLTDARSVCNDEITQREVDLVCELLPIRPEQRILDLCGGHGRHSIALCRRGFHRCTLLDYSGPLLERARSLCAASRYQLELLRAEPARRRVAVLGEMLELGRWSESLHRGVGSYAVSCGIHVLIGIRGAARYTVDEAVMSGLSDSAAFFCEGPEEAGERARELAREGDAILFKGSRGTEVERALEAFLK